MKTPIFDTNVPQFPGDQLAVTQPQFLENMLSLFTAFSKNHVELDQTTNAGNHEAISLLERDNSIQTNISEINVYVKDVEGQEDQIFFKYQDNTTEFQFTNYQIYSLPQTKTRTQYFTVLPGIIMVYFGYFSAQKKSYNLSLSPSVGKNLISYINCLDVSALIDFPSIIESRYKPYVKSVNKNSLGYITSLDLALSPAEAIPNCLYIALVNM